MAITVSTENPRLLLSEIKQRIDSRKIETWSYDTDGDFTHTPQQWKNHAWLRPTISEGNLVLNILKPRDAKLTWEVYGVYHGRFIEMLQIHLHDDFTSATASANATGSDVV